MTRMLLRALASSLLCLGAALAAGDALSDSQFGRELLQVDPTTSLDCLCQVDAPAPPPPDNAPLPEGSFVSEPLKHFVPCACPPPPPPPGPGYAKVSGLYCSLLGAIDCRILPEVLSEPTLPCPGCASDPVELPTECRFRPYDPNIGALSTTVCCVYGLTQDQTGCTGIPDVPPSTVLWPVSTADLPDLYLIGEEPTYLCTDPVESGGLGWPAYVFSPIDDTLTFVTCCKYGLTELEAGNPLQDATVARACAPIPNGRCTRDVIDFTPGPECDTGVDCDITLVDASTPYTAYSVAAGSDVVLPYTLAPLLIATAIELPDIEIRFATYVSDTPGVYPEYYQQTLDLVTGSGITMISVDSPATFVRLAIFNTTTQEDECGSDVLKFTPVCPTCTCGRRRSLIATSAAHSGAEYSLLGSARIPHESCASMPALEKARIAQQLADSLNGRMDRPVAVTSVRCEAHAKAQATANGASEVVLQKGSQALVFEFAAVFGKENSEFGGAMYEGQLPIGAGVTGELVFEEESSIYTHNPMRVLATAGSF